MAVCLSMESVRGLRVVDTKLAVVVAAIIQATPAATTVDQNAEAETGSVVGVVAILIAVFADAFE
jgi:hypothetical protein